MSGILEVVCLEVGTTLLLFKRKSYANSVTLLFAIVLCTLTKYSSYVALVEWHGATGLPSSYAAIVVQPGSGKSALESPMEAWFTGSGQIDVEGRGLKRQPISGMSLKGFSVSMESELESTTAQRAAHRKS